MSSTTSAAHSHAASPNSAFHGQSHSHNLDQHQSHGHSQNTQNQNQDGELFSLDFLALAGLDSGMGEVASASPQSMTAGNGKGDGAGAGAGNSHAQFTQDQWDYLAANSGNGAGPSSHASSSTVTRNPSTDTESTVDGRSTAGGSKTSRRSAGRTGRSRVANDGSRDVNSMDVDLTSAEYSQGQEENQRMGGGHGQGQDFDALQAALLQQQLQAIHMQSPLGFDVSNPQFPLAQMFLSSPAAQLAQLQQQSFLEGQDGGQIGRYRGSIDGIWPVNQGPGGMPTPGASGEIMPQHRQDAMSPIHLEMLARAQSELNVDPNMLPLLSPALSQSTSASTYNSPVTTTAFNSQPPSGHFTVNQNGTRSPLEQLQEQQRQFQEQLAVLQQRQLEMQATAAAVVAASSNSPYGGSSAPSSGQSRPVTTPGVTPNSGFFSPLTSPALEATNRVQQHSQHRHHFSPAFNAQKARTPHPLSALSSPALNPVGYNGGAQQTLSPALGPQTDIDINDPDYLRALVGMMDGNQSSLGEPAPINFNSPSMTSSSTAGYSTILASPALLPTTGTGPHRHSLPSKSRPSPMLKPTNHRLHQRVPSGQNGNCSVPTSPAVQKFHPNPPPPGMGGMGYLPPSAVDHRHLQSGASMSTASTPSPVDLSQIMPPPPVPNGNAKGRKGVAPMTPASLMNLSSAPSIQEEAISTQNHGENQDSFDNQYHQHLEAASAPPPPPPKRGASGGASKAVGRKQGASAATNGASVGGSGGKKAAAGKLAIATNGSGGGSGGKRALAIRPQGSVGVRAATKAAAAALAAPTEPETRKTSHKAAEQKRRDSLKAGFDELRLLLPPINVEALDAETGEPIPGSSAPRLLPKSSLVPDDNPNRGVSKVALLRFSNEYIDKLKERVDRRDVYIERLRDEVRKLRTSEGGVGIAGGDDEDEDDLDRENGSQEEEGEADSGFGDGDILEFDWRAGEDEEFNPPETEEDEGEEGDEGGEEEVGDEWAEEGGEEGMDVEVEPEAEIEDEDEVSLVNGVGKKGRSSAASAMAGGAGAGGGAGSRRRTKSLSNSNPTLTTKSSNHTPGSAIGNHMKRPSLKSRNSSSGTVTTKNR